MNDYIATVDAAAIITAITTKAREIFVIDDLTNALSGIVITAIVDDDGGIVTERAFDKGIDDAMREALVDFDVYLDDMDLFEIGTESIYADKIDNTEDVEVIMWKLNEFAADFLAEVRTIIKSA